MSIDAKNIILSCYNLSHKLFSIYKKEDASTEYYKKTCIKMSVLMDKLKQKHEKFDDKNIFLLIFCRNTVEKMINLMNDNTSCDINLKMSDIDYNLYIQLNQLEFMFLENDDISMCCHESEKKWKQSFQNKQIVDIQTFEQEMLPIFGQNVKFIVKQIDIIMDGYISFFEFDCFLKLYGTLNECVSNFTNMKNLNIHAMNISRWKSDQIILSKKPGSYLIRHSRTNPGHFDIAYIGNDMKVLHYLVDSFTPGCFIFEPNKTIYKTLPKFLDIFDKVFLYPVLDLNN